MSLVKKLLKPAGIATLATALTLSGLGLKTTPTINSNQNTPANSKYNIELTLGPEEAYAGGELPKEFTITDEENFKEIISKYDKAWVKYTFDGEGKVLGSRGNLFWIKLKQEFDTQVNAYIVVNTTGWHKTKGGRTVENEIGKNAFPSFILYENGKIVEMDTGYKCRVRGPPTDEKDAEGMIDYMKKNTFLD